MNIVPWIHILLIIEIKMTSKNALVIMPVFVDSVDSILKMDIKDYAFLMKKTTILTDLYLLNLFQIFFSSETL